MEMKVRGFIPTGARLLLDDQPYTLVERRPFQKADGTMTSLLVWRSSCPGCGTDFETVLAGVGKRPNRRCADCRQPKGGKALGKPFQRVAVVLELPELP